MIRLIITGGEGKMGSRISALAHTAEDLNVVAMTTRKQLLQEVISKGDVIIDFTEPLATAEHANLAAAHETPIVIGTTGLSSKEIAEVESAAKKTAIVFSPNMSVGVNVLFWLTKIGARALQKTFDARIVETHHVHKKDIPSGTAKRLQEIIIAERGKNDVKIDAFREDEVVGDHTVHFSNEGEAIHLTHHAKTRDIFAQGALVAARWIAGKPAGLYSMQDVLGLSKNL